jgi:hypothetical protein
MIGKMIFRYEPLKAQEFASNWRISEIKSPDHPSGMTIEDLK